MTRIVIVIFLISLFFVTASTGLFFSYVFMIYGMMNGGRGTKPTYVKINLFFLLHRLHGIGYSEC
jgi:hypothetical protein